MIHHVVVPPGRPSDGANIRVVGFLAQGKATFLFCPVNTVDGERIDELPIILREFVLLKPRGERDVSEDH